MQTDFWPAVFWGEAESELCCMVDVRTNIAYHKHVCGNIKNLKIMA